MALYRCEKGKQIGQRFIKIGQIDRSYFFAMINILYKKTERTSAMYRMINTYPKLTEKQLAEMREAAAREIHNILMQLIRENEE